MLADYYPSVTAVYSLLREPSLAFLWTHGCTFYVRPFSSGYLNPWTGARYTLGANHEALETGSPEFPRRPLLGSSRIVMTSCSFSTAPYGSGRPAQQTAGRIAAFYSDGHYGNNA